MFAVRINPRKIHPKTTRGHVWVKSSTHPYYVPIQERGLWDTEEEARKAATELWEMIVEVPASEV